MNAAVVATPVSGVRKRHEKPARQHVKGEAMPAMREIWTPAFDISIPNSLETYELSERCG